MLRHEAASARPLPGRGPRRSSARVRSGRLMSADLRPARSTAPSGAPVSTSWSLSPQPMSTGARCRSLRCTSSADAGRRRPAVGSEPDASGLAGRTWTVPRWLAHSPTSTSRPTCVDRDAFRLQANRRETHRDGRRTLLPGSRSTGERAVPAMICTADGQDVCERLIDTRFTLVGAAASS